MTHSSSSLHILVLFWHLHHGISNCSELFFALQDISKQSWPTQTLFYSKMIFFTNLLNTISYYLNFQVLYCSRYLKIKSNCSVCLYLIHIRNLNVCRAIIIINFYEIWYGLSKKSEHVVQEHMERKAYCVAFINFCIKHRFSNDSSFYTFWLTSFST